MEDRRYHKTHFDPDMNVYYVFIEGIIIFDSVCWLLKVLDKKED